MSPLSTEHMPKGEENLEKQVKEVRSGLLSIPSQSWVPQDYYQLVQNYSNPEFT